MSATQDHDDARAQDETSNKHNTSSEDGIPSRDNTSNKPDSSPEDEASSAQNAASTDELAEDDASTRQVSSPEDEASSAQNTASTGELAEDDASTRQVSSPEESNESASTPDAPSTEDASPKEEPSSEIDTITTQERPSEIETAPTQNLTSDDDWPIKDEPSSEVETIATQDLPSEIETAPTQDLPPELENVPTQELSAEGDMLAEKTVVSQEDGATESRAIQNWYVPYQRNPFFNGREDVLQHLHQQLTTYTAEETALPLVISGLSGIGKTQVALEYIYRHRQDYRHIFWINAASEHTLLADYIAIAGIIGLPSGAQSLPEIAPVIRAWLAEQQHWLVVFDNVNDLAALQYYAPQEQATGRILYITNAVLASNSAQIIELPVLEVEQGAYLLLRHTKVLSSGDKLEEAPLDVQTGSRAIVNALSQFPFAIAQAGAYIEATGCDFAKYLKLYEKQRKTLAERGKYIPIQYAEPATATSVLFFRSLEQDYPTALELLCLCACLAPDAIPEDLITRGAPILGPALSPVAFDADALKQAIELLCRFSLVQRYSDGKLLSIHPLVQTILKHEMSRKTLHEWTERTIAAVDAAFPAEKIAWPAYQPYIHQVQTCALLIDAYRISNFVASKLLNNAALVLKEHKQYEQAGPLFERALIIEEQIAGPERPTTAITLNNLATLYHAQGNHERAEACYLRALAIWELEPGLEYPSLSVGYDNLALLYQEQGRYERVETVRKHALAVTEQIWGMIAPETANCFNNLANFYHTQGKYAEAETFYRRSLAILLKVVGTDHAATATSLNNLANLYRNWEKDQQAGPLLHRALLIREKVLGPEHLETASSLSDLANLNLDRGRYQQAEQYLQRAQQIVEKALGPQHTQVAFTLLHLARCYVAQRKNEQAEALFQRILSIDEHTYGPNHAIVATDLENYADFLLQSQRQEEARPLQERAQAIREHQH
jgi:tetratricopeptide (TPR) repeat protein